MFLYPNADFKKVSDISINFLESNNIKALILDVDNTLIDYYNNLSEEIIYWAQNLKKNNIKLYILSNTNNKSLIVFAPATISTLTLLAPILLNKSAKIFLSIISL